MAESDDATIISGFETLEWVSARVDKYILTQGSIHGKSLDRRGLRGQQSPCTGRLDPARDKSLIDVAYVRRPPRRPFFDTSIAPI